MQFELITMKDDDGTQSLTVYIPEREFAKSVRSDNPSYGQIKNLIISYFSRDDQGESLTDEENTGLIDLFNTAEAIARRFERLSDRFTIRNGKIHRDGDPLPKDDPWAQQVLRFFREGVDDWQPLIKFADKLDANPEPNSREQFFRFLSQYPVTITQDGDVVLYKGVNRRTLDDDADDYEFQSTSRGPDTIVDNEEQPAGYVKQAIGSIVEHPRKLVHMDPSLACSNGLHCGNYDYAKSFGTVVIRVLVNPRDVVNVPNHDHKVRVCRYEILDVAEGDVSAEQAMLEVFGNIATGERSIAPSEDPAVVVEADPSVDEGQDAAEMISAISDDSDGFPDYDCEDCEDNGCIECQDTYLEPPITLRHPSPAKWTAIQAERKLRKKGIAAMAKREGWTLIADDQNDRKSWAIES